MGHESLRHPENERLFAGYISPSDPEYIERQRMSRDAFVRSNRGFGGGPIADMPYYQMDDYLTRDDPYSKELLSEVRSFFAEGLANRDIANHPEVQKITRGYVGDLRAPAQMIEAYKNRTLPNEVFDAMVKHHVDRFAKESERFAVEVPELHANFMKNLHQLIADPNYPLTEEMLPQNLVEERVNEIAVVLGDPLELFKKRVSVGGYHHGTSSISVMYDRPIIKGRGMAQYHQSIYNHEMLHVLAGKSIRRISLDIMDRPPLFQAMRIGVGSADTFNWLDEAITETLTSDLQGEKRDLSSGSYLEYRKLYQNLLSRIPEELFLRAYFENGKEGESDTRPEWDKLVAYVEKEFGRDLLGQIDALVETGGIEAGIKVLRDAL